jgi:hypothetical protein
MNQCYNPTPSVGFTAGAHFVDDATMCLKIGDTPKACIFASDHSPVDGMGVPKFPNKPIAFYVAIYHHLPGMRKYRMVLRMISC